MCHESFKSLQLASLEVELEVLGHILICEDELAFTHLPLSKKEAAIEAKRYPIWAARGRKRESDILRVARLNHCEFDEPVAKALTDNFNALCLVSKSVRSLARSVFFGNNIWVLHVTPSFDAIIWIAEHWGLEAMSHMKDVRIKIRGLSKLDHRSLELFVKAVKEAHVLQKLSVQWLRMIGRSIQCARKGGQSWHSQQVGRNRGLERNYEGGRGLTSRDIAGTERGTTYLGRESEPSSWIIEEVVLLPLLELRGLSKVRIAGTVTESWAAYLESSMTKGKFQYVLDSELLPETKAAMKRLEGEVLLQRC